MDRLNINSTTRAATVEFIFDESGVSPIYSDGFLNLSHATLVIDGSSYTGGPATFDLFVSPNVASVSSNVTVTGFGVEGIDYTLTQDTVTNVVQISVTDYPGARATIAALGGLTTAPAVYEDDGDGDNPLGGTPATLSAGDLKTIYYDALDYEGNPTRVYAWIGIPAGASAGSPVPAVVLAHGGGGTAFLEWVQKWNDRGYAAIAMGLEGQTDDTSLPTMNTGWTIHGMPGPVRVGIYGDTGLPLEDQWMYHAVADVVLANSLMRSIPVIDATKIGLHGVSWGGVITSTAIGIDDRFAFAIPTYGCGHLFDVPNQYGTALGNNSFYKYVWDPMLRMDQATMPVLWFSWPQENNFSLDSQAYTYHAAINSTRMVSLVPGMGHGHPPTWNRPESYDYADAIVNSGSPWCVQDSISESGSSVQAVFSSSKALNSASLIYTTGTGYTGDLTWTEIAVNSFVESPAGTWTVDAALPPGTTGWLINVKATATPGYVDTNLIVSSDYREVIDVSTSPSVEIDHPLGQTQSVGNLGVSFTAPTNVEIVDVQFTAESHPGSFSFGEALPYVLWDAVPATSFLPIQFDNSVAGLTDLQTATATLTLVWEDQLDGTTDQLQVPVTVTARAPATVIYSVTAPWSSQSVYSFDGVIINSGAVVTFDTEDTAATLTVQDGALQMTLGNTLFVNDSLGIQSAGAINLTSGMLAPNVDAVQLDGDLTINGGTFQQSVIGIDADFTGSGTLSMVSGSFALTGGAAADLSTFGMLTEISGGSFEVVGQTQIASTGVFKVIGDSASINMDRIFGGSSGTFSFVLGPGGVSPVNIQYYANLQSMSLTVDGLSYEGGPGTHTLVDSTNLNGLVPAGNITVTGFAGQGLDASVEQDPTDGKDWVRLLLTLNDFGVWADGFGLSGADAFAIGNPDHDTLNNTMEYALGGDPTSGTDGNALPYLLPASGGAPGEFEFFYMRRLDAASRGLTYTVLRSTSLESGSWSTAGATETGSTPINGNFEEVTVSIAPADAVFVRLQVDLSE
ncbi:hypothetical protein G0Q06_06405 [Puniceicoccales bacterium CK1056]|uniref:Acetyl xylan esterase domain-containing protein n=2 Tax=Oceanipulchritudo coccoides TaxID=2706888 RepID=A0A6B2M0Z5_9BACT|nr:hypothetical protein [Oceanipulchritudo coccoides]